MDVKKFGRFPIRQRKLRDNIIGTTSIYLRKEVNRMYRYEKPIEKPRSSRYGSNYWLFHSRKVQRRVAVFSNLEYENILTLEMDPEVEWYCEYPLETVVYVGGKEEKILFNVWIKNADGREVYQGVAYKKAAETHKKISLQAKWCIQNGLEYEFRNEENILKGPFFIRNLNVLAARARRFRIQSVNADQMIIGFLAEQQRASLSALESSGRFDDGRTLDYLADLYYRGIVNFRNISGECISGNMEVVYVGK